MRIENEKGLTLTNILNLLVIFCLLRFGLVFTTRWSIFGLPLVVLIGTTVLLFYAVMSKRFAGQLLQGNLLFWAMNLFGVFIVRLWSPSPVYKGLAAGYINQLLVLFLLWGFYLYMQRLSIKQQRRLVGIYLLAVAVSTAYTFYVATTGDDRIIRNTAFGQYDPRFSFAYGGFDFIYGLVLVYVTLLVTLANGSDKIKFGAKLIIILFLILIALTIIASAYSTAFVLVLFSTVLIAPKKLSTKLILLSVIVFLVYVIPVPLTNWFKSISFIPELTTSRISELILSFTGQGSSAYISEDGQRLDLILWSLRIFSEHPLLGVLISGDTSQLGNHTEWIDQLARYGIFTALFNALFWFLTYGKMKRSAEKGSVTYKCIQSTFLVYMILGFLNPISMVVTSAPLFVLCSFTKNLFINEDSGESPSPN